ncbi:YcfL family protein [Marinobacter zhejiangensis]|uniref:DUF1425 domain-containing protein n=1 Tax=Marinobacter zhejiangensis TaxID=488535 RepID=A0A1I4QAU8_9GAMM|nr:YcfL family protein [Marinobacter zhejiangensis]SFM36740.1 hypothetical protein SAMN04487963_2261 [Marinobacter zhejiangensis]
MLRSITIVAVMALLGGLSACAPMQPEREYVQRDDLKVDPEVRQFLAVNELLQARIDQPGGGTLLQVQFSVEAYEDADLEWAVTWFDPSGMVVPSVGQGYHSAHLLRGQTRFFTAIAPHERVTSYQLHLREDR